MTARPRENRKSRRRGILLALGLLVFMLALAAAWRWTPLEEFAKPAVIDDWLDEIADTPWMPVVIAAIYVAASLLLFPNTVLCLGVILALGPLMGTAYAFGGSMLAAMFGYSMGRWGGKRIEKLHVGAVEKICSTLRNGGFVQVLTLRILPVAPFAATNVLAGAARVRLLPFAAATAVGISPYILTFGLFGREARRLLSNPSPQDAAAAVAVVVVAGLVVWWARRRWKDK